MTDSKETIPLEEHHSVMREMAQKVAELEQRVAQAEQNELILWRTFGPAMMQQMQQ